MALTCNPNSKSYLLVNTPIHRDTLVAPIDVVAVLRSVHSLVIIGYPSLIETHPDHFTLADKGCFCVIIQLRSRCHDFPM